MILCPFALDYACKTTIVGISAIYADPIICPARCALPHYCDTCGRSSCYAVDSGNDYDICEDWLPPYYYDEIDEDPEVTE